MLHGNGMTLESPSVNQLRDMNYRKTSKIFKCVICKYLQISYNTYIYHINIS